MAKSNKSIGATLSLKDGNFFANVKKASSGISGLEKKAISASGSLKKLGGVAATVGKGFLTASAVGITAMTGLTVKALGMSGELEQNVGGCETVFKEFAGTLKGVGESAFETMGLSMSDFLGTANKMGALFQGSGFTIAKSTEMTTSAMQRAADVASIMGIDTSAAMEAVAGAAKGNFTMMDNLGVAINDTSIKAYAAAKGIKTVSGAMTTQEKVGIAMEMFMEKTAYAAGNYAKENDTLAGSINTARAALKTFMSGAGSAEGISNALVNVTGVVSKKVSELIPTLATGISKVIKQLSPKIPGLLKSAMPGIVTGAMALVDGLAGVIPSFITTISEALPTILPTLISGFSTVIAKLATAITTNAPALLSGIGEGIKSALSETDLSGVGDILGSALGGLGDTLSGVFDTAEKIYNFFVDNWSLIGPIITGIAGAVVAYKVSVMACNVIEAISAIAKIGLTGATAAETAALGLSSGAMGIYTTVTTVATAVTTAFGAVMAFVTSPIGIVVLAVGALIAVGILLWKNWDNVVTFFKWAGNAIKNAFMSAVNFFKNNWKQIALFITNPFAGIIAFLYKLNPGFKAWVDGVAAKITGVFKNVWEGIKKGVYGISRVFVFVFAMIALVVWKAVKPIVTPIINIFNAVKGPIINAFGAVCDWLKGAWSAVSAFFIVVGTAISGFFTGLWSGISGFAVFVWSGITGFITGTWNHIVTTATAIFTPIVGFFVELWTGIQNFIQPIWDTIALFLSNTWVSITTAATTVFTNFKSTIIGIWDGIWVGIKSVVNLIIGGINKFVSGIVQGVNSVIESINSVSGAIGIPAIKVYAAPQIPMLAKGGNILTSGRVLVGEKGPEYLDLPRGAKVSPLDKTGKENDGRLFGALSGIKSAVTDALRGAAAAVKSFAESAGRGFELFKVEPVSASELLKPIMSVFEKITIAPMSGSDFLKSIMSDIARRVEAVTVKPAPVPDLSRMAMVCIARPIRMTSDYKQPTQPNFSKQPTPSTENGKTENHITININGSNMTPEDVVNALVPKLKLKLANM